MQSRPFPPTSSRPCGPRWQLKHGPKASQVDPSKHAFQLPGLDSPHRNSLSGQAEETHRETLSHALPHPRLKTRTLPSSWGCGIDWPTSASNDWSRWCGRTCQSNATQTNSTKSTNGANERRRRDSLARAVRGDQGRHRGDGQGRLGKSTRSRGKSYRLRGR